MQVQFARSVDRLQRCNVHHACLKAFGTWLSLSGAYKERLPPLRYKGRGSRINNCLSIPRIQSPTRYNRSLICIVLVVIPRRYDSGHVDNIFQARILPHSADRTVVSCAADGQVRGRHDLSPENDHSCVTHVPSPAGLPPDRYADR